VSIALDIAVDIVSHCPYISVHVGLVLHVAPDFFKTDIASSTGFPIDDVCVPNGTILTDANTAGFMELF